MPSSSELPIRIADGTDARTWASTYAPGDTVDWKAIDVAAFSSQPLLRARLDPHGRYSGGKRGRRFRIRDIALMVLGVVLALVIIGSPVWAVASLFSQTFRRPSGTLEWTTRLPVAGIFFAIALVTLVVAFVIWLARGRRAGGFMRWNNWLVLVLGGVSTIGVLFNAETREAVPSGTLWLSVIIAAVAVAVVSAVLMTLLRSRTAPEKPAAVPPAGITRALRRLPDSEQQAIRADLSSAIADLAARGVIKTEQATRAESAEPGTLARSMQGKRR